MNVEQIMTTRAACCGREATLADCAGLMLKNDCGCIPVTEGADGSGRVVGVITDRDITCRAVAKGLDPNKTPVGACMTADPHTVRPEMNLKDAERVMLDNKVRRVPVVGESGECIGILAQADIALAAPSQDVATVVKSISTPYVS